MKGRLSLQIKPSTSRQIDSQWFRSYFMSITVSFAFYWMISVILLDKYFFNNNLFGIFWWSGPLQHWVRQTRMTEYNCTFSYEMLSNKHLFLIKFTSQSYSNYHFTFNFIDLILRKVENNQYRLIKPTYFWFNHLAIRTFNDSLVSTDWHLQFVWLQYDIVYTTCICQTLYMQYMHQFILKPPGNE